MNLRTYFYLSLFFITLFSGCNPARHLPEDQYLVRSNEIEIKDANINQRELQSYIRQSPNRRLLGIYPFHLNVYMYADKRDESRFNNWLKNTVGEPPVIYDQTLTESTANQFELYIQRKGYFKGNVDYDVDFNDRRNHARVTYKVEGRDPYKIRDIGYSIPDDRLKKFIFEDTINSLINRNVPYDADVLQDERNRISNNLREKGFFHFSRDYIRFEVDSTVNTNKVDINVRVLNPVKTYRIDRRDSLVTKKHKRYIIDKIFVFPDYLAMRSSSERPDTTVYYHKNNNDDSTAYYFVHYSPIKVRPPVIIDNLQFEPGEYYNARKVNQSNSFLSSLRIFRFTNIVFDDSKKNTSTSDTLSYLNARVQLTPAPKNSFTIDGEGFNTAGNLGIGTNISFQDRNIFGGAETFNNRFKGALELATDLYQEQTSDRLFNTMEFGGEISFDFPQLIFPVTLDNISAISRPSTTVMAGINFRQRPDYTRYVISLTYGFEWLPSREKRHNLFPAEISSIRVYNDSILRERIPEDSPFILSTFSDHLVTGIRYRYIYNTQKVDRDIDFVYSIINLESAGNLLNLAGKTIGFPKNDDDSYTIFNIPFAQFVKADIDYRYYRIFDKNNRVVYRIMAGAGLPYGNREVLPFIKSYYGGGANSMRAWSIYSLGPGSYTDKDDNNDQPFFDRYGDIKLEANIEYRFNIYRFFEGAFFVDAGNVWYSRKNPDFPGGNFELEYFIDDIAIGVGAGARFDFNFFVLRFDLATPIRNPAWQENERWVSSLPTNIEDYNLNIGVGYPF